MIDQKLWTVKETAAQLGLSLSETYQLIRIGEIEHYRVGPSRGAIRLSGEQIAAFLERRKSGGKRPDATSGRQNRSPPLRHIKKS